MCNYTIHSSDANASYTEILPHNIVKVCSYIYNHV